MMESLPLIRPCGATFPRGGRLGYIFYPVICRLPGNILHQHRLQLHPAQGSVQRIGQQGEITFQAAGLFVAVILTEGHKIVAAPLQKLAQRRGAARQTIVGGGGQYDRPAATQKAFGRQCHRGRADARRQQRHRCAGGGGNDKGIGQLLRAERLHVRGAGLYLLAGGIAVFSFYDQIPEVLGKIVGGAFGLADNAGQTDGSSILNFSGISGGMTGYGMAAAIRSGVSRGVFSNEAGLGSSVMVHSSSNVKEPVAQGMWGIFEVFFDTFVVCTMTAIVVLSSGYIDLETGLAVAGVDDATLVARAFGNVFGPLGEKFVALAMLLFAFTTVLGWSQYGTKAVEYLFGEKATKIYKVIFVVMILSGAVMTSSLAWDISDTFNGLMMLPNLIGVVVLCPMVMKITKNYVNRKIKGIPEEPVLSHFPDIQAEAAASQTDEV